VKNIVLLSDGTGNSAAKRNKTNVWRLYEALDLHDRNQIAMYDDGVGSRDSTWSKIIGGAFGFGLKRNVIDLYKYLCRNYRAEEQNTDDKADRIYLFGFSRGAFTVRVLAGLVTVIGLCCDYDSEEDLHRKAVANYRKYRERYHHGFLSKLINLFRGKPEVCANIHPDIQFIGVWDTVDAYVFPMDELAILWDFLIYPIRFPDQDLSPRVKRACHALAVDDERQTFHPVMWNEKGETERIEQVWFPGVHADVGGGYPKRSLSLVTLDWMISKVEAYLVKDGLVFIDDIREHYHCQSDWNGPQHDSRSGLAMYYRYNPRNIAQINNDPGAGVCIEKARIHRSVFERIRGRSQPYAPTGIPETYELTGTDGATLPYETPQQGVRRSAALNFALDVIYWRRWLYFALWLLTIALLASRFYLPWQDDGICKGSACFIDPVIQYLIDTLPDFLAGWFEALRQNPMRLWGFVVLFGVFFLLRRYAWAATRNRAMHAWSELKDKGEPPTWSGSVTSRLRRLQQTVLDKIMNWSGAVLLLVVILYLLAAVISGISFHFRDTLGTLCDNSDALSDISTPRTVSFDIDNACYATGIRMTQGKTYRFSVKDAKLHDGSEPSGPDGYSSAALFYAVPWRRHISERWLKVFGRINRGGHENIALGGGSTEYTARGDGELFLYVNDAVFGIGPAWDLPYRWARGRNSGRVSVTISTEEPIKRIGDQD
jgi:uncharacterized protein (DUF2235 family)